MRTACRVKYNGGFSEVRLGNLKNCELSKALSEVQKNGYAVVRQISSLREACEETIELEELFNILLIELGFKNNKPPLMSMIQRKPPANTYGGVVHRDLDEQAVTNLKENMINPLFINAWVPLAPIPGPEYSLGICVPAPCWSTRICGFMGLEHDRTSLSSSEDDKWLYAADLMPGDVLLFDSHRTFHSSLTPIKETEPTRYSVDFRFKIDLCSPTQRRLFSHYKRRLMLKRDRSSDEEKQIVLELESVAIQMAELTDRKKKLKNRLKDFQLKRDDEKSAEHRSKNWSSGFEWDDKVFNALKSLGFESFRPNQRECINGILSGSDVFTIMPTGAGKSLCFQLPATMWAGNGTIIVISPLIALMNDQVSALKKQNIEAAMICSVTPPAEKKNLLSKVEDGKVTLLYVTPEFVAKSKTLLSKMQKCDQKNKLKLFVIDEAHCCSQWGHEFRHDYLKLAILRETYPTVPILALTATATEGCRKDIISQLKMTTPVLTLKGHYNRSNLVYNVTLRNRKDLKNKHDADIAWIVNHVIENNYTGCTGLVYCLSCKEVDTLSKGLNDSGLSAAGYHAQMDLSERQKSYEKWMSGKALVIVATIAFGMGIDKPDVRYVIHHSVPKSIENYYQESGRAGRDGKPATCTMFYRPSDISRLSGFIAENPNREENLKRLYNLAEYVDPTKPECRRKAMAFYFSDTWKESDCSMKCDFCRNEKTAMQKSQNCTTLSRNIISIVENTSSEVKLTSIRLIESLYSNNAQSKLIRRGTSPPMTSQNVDQQTAERVIVKLLRNGYLKEVFTFTSYGCNAYLAATGKDFIEEISLAPMDTN